MAVRWCRVASVLGAFWPDKSWDYRLAVAQLIVEELDMLDNAPPQTDPA